MKKFIFSFAVFAVFVSCTQTEMKQTTDTIKQADSLFQSANDGFKTLDSISQIVQDSAKFNKVVVPEIEKHKKSVEEVIQNSAKSLDSINAVIKKTTDQINKSADVVKTVDSAGKVLKDSKNPIDALSTISKTIEKVSKQSKKNPVTKTENTTVPASPQETEITEPARNPQNSAIPESEPIMTNPLVRTAKMVITVENVDDTRIVLATELYKYSGEIVTESFGEEQGVRKQMITAKVPYKYFEEATRNISQKMGTLRTKNIYSEGKDYDPNQMCDIEITFTEDAQYAVNETIKSENNPENSNFGEKSSDAFMKGFKVFGDALLFLLPFWPLFLIAGIAYYFYSKNKRKKEQHSQQRFEEKYYESVPQKKPELNPSNEVTNEVTNDATDPYEKYKPKQ